MLDTESKPGRWLVDCLPLCFLLPVLWSYGNWFHKGVAANSRVGSMMGISCTGWRNETFLLRFCGVRKIHGGCIAYLKQHSYLLKKASKETTFLVARVFVPEGAFLFSCSDAWYDFSDLAVWPILFPSSFLTQDTSHLLDQGDVTGK